MCRTRKTSRRELQINDCNREAHILLNRMLDSCCEKLLEHVKKLASKQNGKNPNEAELKIIFEKKWIEWMQEFTVRLPKVYQHNVDIDTSFERCLRDLL